MDTTPIYELRERLFAAAMAGTSLLSEDFRLRHVYDIFKPLEKTSPVFAKVSQLTEQLLLPDCQNPQSVLLDDITLVDAVICTLGTVEIVGEVEPAEGFYVEENAGSMTVNIPYSILKELLRALTTRSEKYYMYVCDTRDNHPELFRDYRVKHALVQTLGFAYSDLADKAEQWLIEDDDKTALPALYKDFDPKGKEEMVRRVRVISALAGARANDFYIKMLDEAQKDVRTALIDALRHEPRNVSLLLELTKTEKGESKEKVYELLTEMQDKSVKGFFEEMTKKKQKTVLKYIRNATTDWSAELMADICDKLIETLDTADNVSDRKKQEILESLYNVLRAVFGKGGARICECYRKLLARKEKINNLLEETWQKSKYADYGRNTLQYGVLTPSVNWYETKGVDIEAALGKILHHSLIVNPDSDLKSLALALYQDRNSKRTNEKFLSAAVTVKLSDEFSTGESCADWLAEQIPEKVVSVSEHARACMRAVIEAMDYVVLLWDSKKSSYKLYGEYVDVYYSNCKNKSVERPIRLPHAKGLIRWIVKYGASREVDRILMHLVSSYDETTHREIGEYYYKRALNCPDNYYFTLGIYMKTFEWTVCKGLGVNAVKSDLTIRTKALYNWLVLMPGDKDAVMEEMRTICRMVKSGELKAKNLDLEVLENDMNKWYKG